MKKLLPCCVSLPGQNNSDTCWVPHLRRSDHRCFFGIIESVNFKKASTRSLRPTRALVKARARLTDVGMTSYKKFTSTLKLL